MIAINSGCSIFLVCSNCTLWLFFGRGGGLNVSSSGQYQGGAERGRESDFMGFPSAGALSRVENIYKPTSWSRTACTRTLVLVRSQRKKHFYCFELSVGL